MRSTNTIALISYNFQTSDSIVPEMDCENSGSVNLDHLKNMFLTELLYKIFGHMFICLQSTLISTGALSTESAQNTQRRGNFCCYLKC